MNLCIYARTLDNKLKQNFYFINYKQLCDFFAFYYLYLVFSLLYHDQNWPVTTCCESLFYMILYILFTHPEWSIVRILRKGTEWMVDDTL